MNNATKGDRKWASLQSTMKVNLDKMITGTASPADVKAVSLALAQQNQIAQTLFDVGVSDVQRGAVAKVQEVNAGRVSLGKKPLTEKATERITARTFQDMLAAAVLDIIQSVDNLLKTQAREKQLGDAYKSATNKPTIGVRNTVSAPPALGSNNVTLVKRVLDSAQNAKQGSQSNNRDNDPDKLGVWNLIKRMSDKRKPQASSLDSVMKRHGATDDSSVTKFMQKNGSSDASIQQALTDNRTLRNRAMLEWDAQKQSNSNQERDEAKRNDSWLRKLRGLMGPKKKREDSGGSGLAGLLAKSLFAALMHPQLLKSIGDTVAEYLNFDSITSFINSTWETIKGGGGQILDYVVEKVKGFFKTDVKAALPTTAADRTVMTNRVMQDSKAPADLTPERAKQMIPRFEKQIENTKVELAKNRAAYAKSPTDENKVKLSRSTQRLAILEGQLSSWQQKAGVTQTMPTRSAAQVQAIMDTIPGNEAPKSSAGPTGAQPAGSTSVSTGLPKVSAPASSTAPAGSTSVTTPDIPTYKPGKSFDDPAAMQNAQASQAPSSSGGSFSPTTINSFNYASGDDTLNLLNMGLIG